MEVLDSSENQIEIHSYLSGKNREIIIFGIYIATQKMKDACSQLSSLSEIYQGTGEIQEKKKKSEKEIIQPPYVEVMTISIYVLSDCCFLLFLLGLSRSKEIG